MGSRKYGRDRGAKGRGRVDEKGEKRTGGKKRKRRYIMSHVTNREQRDEGGEKTHPEEKWERRGMRDAEAGKDRKGEM